MCKTACCLNLAKTHQRSRECPGLWRRQRQRWWWRWSGRRWQWRSRVHCWLLESEKSAKSFCRRQMCGIIVTVWRRLVTKQTDYQALHQVQSCAVTREKLEKESFKKRIVRIRIFGLFWLIFASIFPLRYFEGVLAVNGFLFGKKTWNQFLAQQEEPKRF